VTDCHDHETIAALDAFEAALPGLIEAYRKLPVDSHRIIPGFWAMFDNMTGIFFEHVAPSDRPYAEGRIDRMLTNAGLTRGVELAAAPTLTATP